MTSQHILYYSTYYSVSLTCTVLTVHCTPYVHSLFPCSAHHHRLLVFTLSQHLSSFTFTLSVIGFTILNTLSTVHPFHLCWVTISIFDSTSIKKCTSYLRLSTNNYQLSLPTCRQEKERREQLSRSIILARNSTWDRERVVEPDAPIRPLLFSRDRTDRALRDSDRLQR